MRFPVVSETLLAATSIDQGNSTYSMTEIEMSA
jgi:hypothetical protein